MFNYIWPIALIVACNTIYQVCTKEVPQDVHPMASLTVTYLVAALFAGALYFLGNHGSAPWREWSHLNWSSYGLGLTIVGLEAGFIYAYQNGWEVSKASIVQSSFLALSLLAVGLLVYKEPLSWNKLIGISLCMVGLVFINK